MSSPKMKTHVINIEQKIACFFTYVVPVLFKHSYIL